MAEKQSDKKTTKSTTGLNIICGILTIILTALMIFHFSVRSILKNTEIDKDLQNIDYLKINVEVDGEVMSLPKYINDFYILDEKITDDDINNLLKKSTASAYLTDKYNELAQYLLGGSYKVPMIKTDEIASLLDENKDMIYENSSIKFLSDDHHELKEALKAPLETFNQTFSESAEMSAMRFLCSTVFTVLLIVLMVIVFVVWIFNYSKINHKNYPVIRDFGIIVCLTSIVSSIFFMIEENKPNVITRLTDSVDLTNFGKNAFGRCTIISYIFLGAGVVIVIAGLISAIVHRKNYIGDIKESDRIEKEIAGEDDTETIYSVDKEAEQDKGVEVESIYYDGNDKAIEQQKTEKPKISKDEIDKLIDEITPNSKERNDPAKQIPNDNVFEIENEMSEQPKPSKHEKLPEQPKPSKHEKTADDIKQENSPEETEIQMPEINSDEAIPVNGRVCPKCGKVNLSRNLFCSKCGALLK